MLFGMKLATGIYEPWKEYYLDYDKLKELLKESEFSNTTDKHNSNTFSGNSKLVWSDDDESRFVELLDGELEKVYSFQAEKYNILLDRLNRLEDKLSDSLAKSAKDSSINFEEFKNNLEIILLEANGLDNFTRLNYTGFIKIVKKHDKLHPQFASVKSLLEVRLKKLPLHSEEYSPLLYQISYLYNIIRNSTTNNMISNSISLNSLSKSVINENNISNSFVDEESFVFKSLKFWIHKDNLMEVKTRILRHLPVLLYAAAPTENDDMTHSMENDVILSDNIMNTSSTKSDSTTNLDNKIFANRGSGTDREGSKRYGYDPVINTLYFDNENFELYHDKLVRTKDAPTLRLRWVGHLYENPDIFLEKRIVSTSKPVSAGDENSNLNEMIDFKELRIKLKEKYINDFIFNEGLKYKEQTLKNLEKIRANPELFSENKKNIDTLQKFIVENDLQPVLRTRYTRTAFQIPGDDRVRVTIDSDILYIREDSFDKSRPIRDSDSWHRFDIDANVANPMRFLRKGEYTDFPFAVMEIKIRSDNFKNLRQTPTMSSSMVSGKGSKKHYKWIHELTNSHLVKEVPKFSKYSQGVASLFGDDDKLDILPFWLPSLENDIKKDPKEAYEEEIMREEKQKKIQKKLDEMRKATNMHNKGTNKNEDIQDTAAQTAPQSAISSGRNNEADLVGNESSDEEDDEQNIRRGTKSKKYKNRNKKDLNFLQVLSGRDAKLNGFDSEDEEIELPPGVIKPTSLIKNAGPIKVEAKVWLANERTFNRWLKVTTLFSILTFSIYNSVKKADYPHVADTLAYLYFGLTLFCGVWSYIIYIKRLNVIKERSGDHLDAPLGPILVAVFLSLTLIVNFVLSFRAQARRQLIDDSLRVTTNSINNNSWKLQIIQNFIFRVVGTAAS
ncbi:hypothetical protein TPHA_0D00600 [Tetrapisispora phaffii CBS 4417]|uniref:SPX domain-containing protein n=1 Tax=Tetrapisispora phaffii (strain ATCC 24235 / CBS 4417 / NBRC 1672 / NRRL Y-8282 / UCD 70-5) TaxID=1071381 RepID=G8BS83_TETPH|nr:hypothetical protein TPHA_0D00600 [Tetrapisispora phaffii CBS 4417]CCE62704.1 hypothetical protein TPHA_0D00600 [Tetrapisispora phaffii CBS 4417]